MPTDQTITRHAKECLALYKELYVKHVGRAPEVNEYRDLWGFRNMVKERGKDEAIVAIRYYFDYEHKFNQNLIELFKNYDVFLVDIKEKAVDKANREKLRIESAKRAKEWKEKNGAGSGTAS